MEQRGQIMKQHIERRVEKIGDKQSENEAEIVIQMEIRASPFYHQILSSSKTHV